MASAKENDQSQTEFKETSKTPSVQGGLENTSISLQDLNSLAQIVDLATSRGAFRAGELTQVGAIYDKLTGFLRHVAASQGEAEEQKEEE